MSPIGRPPRRIGPRPDLEPPLQRLRTGGPSGPQTGPIRQPLAELPITGLPRPHAIRSIGGLAPRKSVQNVAQLFGQIAGGIRARLDSPVALVPGRPQGGPQRPEAAQFRGAIQAMLSPWRAQRPPVPVQLQPVIPLPYQPANRPQLPPKLYMPLQRLPHQHWQQAMPQGLPQQPAYARPNAYPIKVRPPVNGHPLLPPQHERATSVPLATLPPDIDRLYKQLNLKVTSDTRPMYTNHNLLARPTKLGSGTSNTVYEVRLRHPDGSVFDGVFKPLEYMERGAVAHMTGIPRDNPQIAMRNIATLSYAKTLGIDVVPETRVAVLSSEPDARSNGPRLGLVMERARGMEARDVPKEMFARPDVCAEVTKLQLLDHLTGQGDRHSSNYFINIENGRAKVTGIDNDQCFGYRVTDPNGIQEVPGHPFGYFFNGTSMPPVVDSEMAIKITSMTHQDIRAMLGDKLSEPEVRAAIMRHEGVKQHIMQLERQGRIIDPADWGAPFVQRALNKQNSYIGRERERARGQWEGSAYEFLV